MNQPVVCRRGRGNRTSTWGHRTRARLCGLACLAICLVGAKVVRADVAVPKPLGFRAVERSQTFTGIAAHPELAFFVWPVVLDHDHCRVVADPIREGATFRVRAQRRCVRTRPRTVYADARCAPCRDVHARVPTAAAKLFDDPVDEAGPASPTAAAPPQLRDARGEVIDCQRCEAEATKVWTSLPPRLMAMPATAFAAAKPSDWDEDDVPEGALVADAALPQPRWVTLDDRVVDEREEVRVDVRGGSLHIVPSRLTTITRDARAEQVAARADGTYPPAALPGADDAPAYRMVFRGLAAHPGWRLYLPTQDDQIFDRYVQTHLIEVREGEEIAVAMRHRLPTLLAVPAERGPPPAGAKLIVDDARADAVRLLVGAEDFETSGLRFGTQLTAFAPPRHIPDIRAVVDVVELDASDWAAARDSRDAPHGAVEVRRLEARFVYDHGFETRESFPPDPAVEGSATVGEAPTAALVPDDAELAADGAAPIEEDDDARRRLGLGAYEVDSVALQAAVGRLVGPRPDAPRPDPRPTPPSLGWLVGRRVALGTLAAGLALAWLRWRSRPGRGDGRTSS